MVVTALLLGIRLVAAQQGPSMHQGTIRIRGTVHDAAGRLVSGASVRLEQQSSKAASEAKSNASGQFAFSGLAPGTYVLAAEKSGLQSHKAVVTASVGGDVPVVSLVLENAGAAGASGKGASMASTQAMEFADNPNFTVAAVTDWTAAGGHGSDSTLRASEALTRETLALQSQNTKHSAASSAGHAGATSESEKKLIAAKEANPGSFETNHNLGAFYLRFGRFTEAVPLLQTAYKVRPGDFENEYDLAQALKGSGDFGQARSHVERLLAQHDQADLHRMAGEIDEKLNDPLAAVREFEKAARENPSEENYFAWGSELLFHRAVWQAKEVFEEGVRAYPRSGRMLTALGTALFSGALYDEAAQRLCEASDLNPSDAEPYLFMGKVEMASPNPLPCVEQKLARFVQLQPNNALANYYYAMTLWKQQGPVINQRAQAQVESLLTRAVHVDPQCSEAYLQLGNLSSQQRAYQKAIGFYVKAIDVNPQLSEAHYRLGVAYDRTGERAKAKQEFQLHDELQKQQAAAVERQRKEIKQFLVVEPGQSTATPKQP